MRHRLAALVLLLAWPAGGYYHFVRYASSTPPYQPIYDRFDLRSLPGKAVPYLITLNGSLTLADGDSEAAVLSQIRAAAAVWNRVDTAEIRLVFGGFRGENGDMGSPFIQVEFTDELPPGVIAQGGPVARLDPAEGPDGTFTPIARSLLRLPKDLSSRPSWSERFFLTIVHEFGHTMGLQHSWASSVMSTEITRGTTKAQPLSQDDIAALSVLYPAPNFRKTTGVITGRVTLNGQGVALASVVAIVSGRTAVSALTAPDGTYRIEGLLPGSYFVYAHPLPPAIAGEPLPVNLTLPETAAGRVLPGPAFQTVFYPGTPAPVSTVIVEAGHSVEGVDFQVSPTDRVSLHSVQTYSFFNRNAIKPAVLQSTSDWRSIVFTGYGASTLASELSVSFLNAPETVVPGSLRQYSQGYLQADVSISPFSGTGPRHLIFRLGGETYVLPSGVLITRKSPPSVTSITSQPDGWLLLEGSSLEAATAVWVDGVPARTKFSDGRLLVLPPPAPAGHRGVLTLLNPDGQSSLFVYGDSSPVISYAGAAPPVVEVQSLEIPAGAEMAVEIRGSGTDFRQWSPWLATGTSDVVVRKVWATGAQSALAWLAASSSASPTVVPLSSVIGLAAARLPQTLAVVSANPTPFVRMSGMEGQILFPGGAAALPVTNLPPTATPANSSATVGGVAAPVVRVSEGLVTIQIPSALKPGAYLVQLSLAGVEALPAAVEVGPIPPMILYALRSDRSLVSASNAPRVGDVVQLVVGALGEEAEIPTDSVLVFSGDVQHTVLSVRPNEKEPGTYLVEVRLSAVEATEGTIPLTIARNGLTSLVPYRLPVAP
ncbi:MAG: matrixin family metalloprotease [Bryobacteraceae bacterium]